MVRDEITSEKIFALVVFSCLVNFYECNASINRSPTLNKCCPDGSFYSFEKETCVEFSLELLKNDEKTQNKNITFEVGGANFSSYKTDPLLGDFIILPRNLVFNFGNDTPEDFRFRLKPHLPNQSCSNGNFIVEISLTEKVGNDSSGNVESPTLPGKFSPPPANTLDFTSRGQIKIDNEYYSPPEFCLIGLKDQILTVRVCNATCTGETPCIRKCCDLNQVWNIAKGRRQGCHLAGKHLWEPEFYKYPKTITTESELENIFPHYKILHPRRFCDSSTVPIAIEQRDGLGRNYWKFRINLDGHIFHRMSRYTWKYEDDHPDSYCLDGAINSRFSPEDEADQTEFSGAREDGVLFECLPSIPTTGRPQSILYGILMVFSCFFLLLTILVHILLWDRQPNHAWTLTLISYDLSLFFLYFFLVLMHISSFYIFQSPVDQINPLCYSIAVGINFFVVSTFCWMSAVNFDLFRTFKVLKPTTGRSQGLRRYLGYALFSWIVPITIVTVGVVLDSMYRNDFDSGIIVPEYGRKRCQLDSEYAQMFYSYGPAGILLIFNLICFAFTVYTMYSVQKSTKFATTSSSKKNKQKQSIKLFAKLIFVMGFPWIFEILSWYTDKDKTDGNSWYWVLFDVINILQALAIFWTFVCKPDVIRMLEQKYPCFESFLDRVMLHKDSADKISGSHPTLKRFVKPITRRNKESVSGGRSGGPTEISSFSSSTTAAPDSVKRADVKLESKISTKSNHSSK